MTRATAMASLVDVLTKAHKRTAAPHLIRIITGTQEIVEVVNGRDAAWDRATQIVLTEKKRDVVWRVSVESSIPKTAREAPPISTSMIRNYK